MSCVALVGGKTESSGKYYLKKILHSKGNNYRRPSNHKCLPEIRATTINKLLMTPLRKENSIKETKSQNGPNHRQKNKNDKMFLLPLNVNVLKNHKKHKHGL